MGTQIKEGAVVTFTEGELPQKAVVVSDTCLEKDTIPVIFFGEKTQVDVPTEYLVMDFKDLIDY